jgi:hypothetical protein
MDFTTKMTESNETLTWAQDVARITAVGYDTGSRTILITHDGNIVKCRIGMYPREKAVALWKAITRAHKKNHLVCLGSHGNWAPTEWFCAIHDHTDDYLDAEECAYAIMNNPVFSSVRA